MFTEKNFKSALELMNFEKISADFYQKIFGENISMSVDFKNKKLSYPENLKVNRDGIKNFSQNENFVVFECVHRLLDKGYKPETIEIEKPYPLGHLQKSGRSDITVTFNQKTLFIIECKTFGAEFNHALKILNSDGGQLFSYWQQEKSCKWLQLYASSFDENNLIFSAKSIKCDEEIYKNASNKDELFKIWSEIFEKQLFDDVIFHDETIAYKIGVKPLRKKDLKEFPDTSIVNIYEEILRHNSVTNKQNAFDALLELFICKLADESQKNLNDEVDFQFKFGSDNFEIFIDRLQKLYHQGMEEFMHINTTYSPLSVVENLLQQNQGENRKNLENLFKEEFNKLKFYTPSIFNFIKVLNREIFYKNSKIVREVVDIFKNYRIIGAKNLQTLGDLFEQLLDKGFKQDEGQFFTPLPITRFIWDSLPLEKIISAEKNFNPPKIIDYACGAGHFLTQGYEAINDFFTKNNIKPPIFWENEKLFGIEKNDRLSTVSKVAFFMHGADKGKIKWGDGLENFDEEGISAESFDILVSNPPYSIKNFKQYLEVKNKFETLEKISESGKEIETLFVERIAQLLKVGGIAAVILPSSILNKDGGSFTTAREIILKNFYIRAIAEFGSKTFSSTGTKTNILFLEKISNPPKKFELYADTVNIIFSGKFSSEWNDEEIFKAWLKKIKIEKNIYEKFIRREIPFYEWENDAYFGEYFSEYVGRTPKVRALLEKLNGGLFAYLKIGENNFCVPKSPELENFNRKFYDFAQEIEREKIQYFAQTYTQTMLIISAPDDNSLQEKFLGYKWSNRKGDEGIKISSGGLLYDQNNRRAENKLAAAVRKSFYGEQIQIPDAQNYFYYLNLADMIDFSGVNFTKIIRRVSTSENAIDIKHFDEKILKKLSEVCKINIPKTEVKDIPDETLISFVEMSSVSNNGYISEKVDKKISEVRKGGYTYFAEGDIIIAKITPCMENGKCAIAKNLTNLIGFGSTEFHTFRCDKEKILTEYLFILLNQNFIRESAKKSMTGASGHRRVPEKFYSELIIPVPPIEEQKKIVEEFSSVDEKINLQEKIISDCDLAIKNKFAEMFLDKNFPIRKWEEVLTIQTGRDYKSVKNSEGKFPVYGSGGIIDRADEFICSENSIVIGRKGTINNPIFVREKFWNIDTAFGIIADEKFILPEYLFYFCLQFNFETLNHQLTLPSLARKDLYKILIPIPPKELQEKFSEYVRLSEENKKSAQKLIDELKASREALVEKYFR